MPFWEANFLHSLILSGGIAATGDNAGVRNQERIVLVIMIAIVIAGLVFYLSPSREPRYQGKSLSTWLRAKPVWPEEDDLARIAVRNIGTNAIPTLLRMLRETNSPSTLKMIAFSQRFDLPLSTVLPKVAKDENHLAMRGFYWLGAEASNAAPELLNIYHQNISESSQYNALYSLIAVNPPPQCNALLNEALTNRFESVRRTALFQLTPTNQPDVAVPLLIKALGDPLSSTQFLAAHRLIRFGTNALLAVPALVRLACSAPSNSRDTSSPAFAANRTLCILDPQTAAKVLTNGFWTYEKFVNGKYPVFPGPPPARQISKLKPNR